jgi:hypothetical protein
MIERQIMNFTPKKNVGSVVGGALTIAVVGLIGWIYHVAPAPIVATHNTLAVQESSQMTDHIPIISTVDAIPTTGLQAAVPDYYQPVSTGSHKNRHWLKRNAPILGGIGGGALIGGLAGGGTGALIGGAVGGGGGYLYKRSRRHHHQ